MLGGVPLKGCARLSPGLWHFLFNCINRCSDKALGEMMDTDHYRLFQVGFYLAISISACLCKEPTAPERTKGEMRQQLPCEGHRTAGALGGLHGEMGVRSKTSSQL